ncbi:hypothetical protein NQZ68_020842 [Dissostichus eleginoides]|nr:hypothetical protein NQZ68_020842 [Dissostichus eleginoides]
MEALSGISRSFGGCDPISKGRSCKKGTMGCWGTTSGPRSRSVTGRFALPFSDPHLHHHSEHSGTDREQSRGERDEEVERGTHTGREKLDQLQTEGGQRDC